MTYMKIDSMTYAEINLGVRIRRSKFQVVAPKISIAAFDKCGVEMLPCLAKAERQGAAPIAFLLGKESE